MDFCIVVKRTKKPEKSLYYSAGCDSLAFSPIKYSRSFDNGVVLFPEKRFDAECAWSRTSNFRNWTSDARRISSACSNCSAANLK